MTTKAQTPITPERLAILTEALEAVRQELLDTMASIPTAAAIDLLDASAGIKKAQAAMAAAATKVA